MPVYDLAPVESKTMWWIAGVVVVAVFAGASLLILSRPPKFEVTPEGLRITGNVFGRTIPAADLRLDAAHVVDFARSPDLRPKWRTFGIGLPSYRAGWFRLYDGEKALVFLSDSKPAVYIPTTLGYSLLISPQDPDGFLSSLAVIAH
ncbi:MAG: PH domain-containing protein [Xanthobacteraceae bacterium]